MSDKTKAAIADRERRARGEPPPRPAKKPKKEQPAEQPSPEDEDGG